MKAITNTGKRGGKQEIVQRKGSQTEEGRAVRCQSLVII